VPGRRHPRRRPGLRDTTVAAIRERFAAGDITGGIVHGVETIGAQLARYFPPRPDDVNELPDAVR
jgi:uncharacterized membrane protein